MMQKLLAFVVSLTIAAALCLLPGIAAASAANSEPSILSIQDLPAGFVRVPAAEVEGCQPQGDRGQLAAFVLKTNQGWQESICLSSFLLTEQAANPGQAALMRQMFDAILDHPEAMVEQAGPQQEAKAQPGSVSVLRASGLGDKAAGFKQQTADRQHEILLFRRGDCFGSVAVHYPTGTLPPVTAQTIAAQLDRQLSQLQGDRQPADAATVR